MSQRARTVAFTTGVLAFGCLAGAGAAPGGGQDVIVPQDVIAPQDELVPQDVLVLEDHGVPEPEAGQQDRDVVIQFDGPVVEESEAPVILRLENAPPGEGPPPGSPEVLRLDAEAADVAGPADVVRFYQAVGDRPVGGARRIVVARAAPAAATEKAAYLGVGTSPATPALRQHLKLPKGTGLIVESVAP